MSDHKIVSRLNRKPLWSLFALSFIFSCMWLPSAHARELTVNNELFVEISEMIVPIIQRRRVKGFFSITLAVDCPTMEASQRVQKIIPILRDKFFWDMYVLLGVIWSPEFRTDIKEMKKRLKKRADQILGKDYVTDILVINFQEHERRNENT